MVVEDVVVEDEEAVEAVVHFLLQHNFLHLPKTSIHPLTQKLHLCSSRVLKTICRNMKSAHFSNNSANYDHSSALIVLTARL
jgi:hypothetical protein